MTVPEWMYDEMRQIGTDYTSEAEVEAYDIRMRKIRDIDREIEHILAAVSPGQNHRVLEFGTGTGEFAVAAAKKCARVYALDISPVMLGYTRKKAETRGVENIVFKCGGFLTYRHRDEPVDAVVTQMALHHLPDLWKLIALRNINSILKDQGKFYLRDVVFSSGENSYHEYFSAWRSQIESVGGGKFAESINTHIKNEYSTLDWIMEGLLRNAGFSIDSMSTPEKCINVYVCTKKKNVKELV